MAAIKSCVGMTAACGVVFIFVGLVVHYGGSATSDDGIFYFLAMNWQITLLLGIILLVVAIIYAIAKRKG